MKQFYTAVKETDEATTEDDIIVFMHDDTEVTFFQPSSGQIALMLSIVNNARVEPKNAGAFIQLFFEMMDDETQVYFQQRLMDRKDSFDLEGEGGMFQIFEHLSEEWSARPTKQPSDYQPPRRATGKKSTATTQAVGSTSSRSRSRVSST